MIAKMRKYSFVLFHRDYEAFLGTLQKMGVVHIIRDKDIKTESLIQNRELIENYREACKYLRKLIDENSELLQTNLLPKMLYKQIEAARAKQDNLQRQLEMLSRQIQELKPWGYFDLQMLSKLKSDGIAVHFYSCSRNHFKADWQESYALKIISDTMGTVYFTVLSKVDEKPIIDADLLMLGERSLATLESEYGTIKSESEAVQQYLSNHAKIALKLFEEEIVRLSMDIDYEDAVHQADRHADEYIAVLNGWIPIDEEKALLNYLDENSVIYFKSDPKDEDEVPVMLQNGWFAKLYEPIAKLFMLPKYNDMDLTPFFAPFFMLFFGFCNADMGYGLVLILFALFMKKKLKKPEVIPYMNLIMLFGIATTVMGWAMGSVFAYDMKNMPIVGGSIPIRETNQIFNFALILGVIQILFGILVNAGKQIRQSGFKYGIASIGTFLFLLSAVIMGSTVMGANPGILGVYAKYPMYLGLAMVFLFNSPKKNIIINILSGIWIMYNVLTGFFGDLLSYIRLFALGVSSAILGIVVNAMAAQFSAVPVIGPVIFLVFMVFGHTLNLALGALSGFVHPLRLTFVEFYKNAGFSGPGPEYKPFGKKISVK